MSFWADIHDSLFQKQGIWQIEEKLFILSAIREPEKVKAAGINVLYDLEGFRDRDIAWLTYYGYWPIKDEPRLPDLWELSGRAWDAYQWWEKGYTVGIHCRMGKNRAALVTGEVLRLSGMTGPETVRLIREKRPGALSNEVFREYLERG